MRDDRAGKAIPLMDAGDPTGLADLVGAVPFSFAMHRRQHIVAGGVAPVILGQIVAPDRAVVAHEKIMARLADEVRMLLLRQVPQMMVRIDQGDRVGGVVPAAVDRVHYVSPLAKLRRYPYVYEDRISYTSSQRCAPT